MRHHIAALWFVACISVALSAQQVEYLETVKSPVQMYQSNVGITGFNAALAKAGIVWPRGSDNQFVFGMGLWLGGQVLVAENTYSKLVAITYNPNAGTGWFQPTSGLETDDDVSAKSMLYNSTFNDRDISTYDDMSKREAEGYPLGLDVQQRLTVFTDGPLKDVAILKSNVRNTHATRDIHLFVLGTVMDVDIGKTTSGLEAAMHDRSEVLASRADLGIMKFWDDQAGAKNPGVLGIAFVDEPAWDAMGSAKVESLVEFTYTENRDRYDAMSTQSWTGGTAPGDIIALFGKSPRALPVGATIHSTLVLMFGSENSTENDQTMISTVETLRSAVGVHDDAMALSHTSIFPNPATASHVYMLSDRDIDRLEVYTALGKLVKSLSKPSSTINIEDMPAGQFHLVLYSGREIDHHRLVVFR